MNEVTGVALGTTPGGATDCPAAAGISPHASAVARSTPGCSTTTWDPSAIDSSVTGTLTTTRSGGPCGRAAPPVRGRSRRRCRHGSPRSCPPADPRPGPAPPSRTRMPSGPRRRRDRDAVRTAGPEGAQGHHGGQARILGARADSGAEDRERQADAASARPHSSPSRTPRNASRVIASMPRTAPAGAMTVIPADTGCATPSRMSVPSPSR